MLWSRKKAQQMDANLEPESDVGFGVGKKPTTDYTKDDVIILDSMGCSFGTTDNPIIIDDEKSSKKETGTFRISKLSLSSSFPISVENSAIFLFVKFYPDWKPKKKKVIEISDDEEDVETKVEKEKKKKKTFNEKLFEQLSSKLNSEPKKSQKNNRPKNTVDPGFAAELEKIKGTRVYYF